MLIEVVVLDNVDGSSSQTEVINTDHIVRVRAVPTMHDPNSFQPPEERAVIKLVTGELLTVRGTVRAVLNAKRAFAA